MFFGHILVSLFDIFKKFQIVLGTSFYYTLIVMQDFLNTSVFNISFAFLDFPGTFLLHILFFPRIFMVSTRFSWYLTFWNVIFNIRFSTFFILILFYRFLFTVISPFNCLSFHFWIAFFFSVSRLLVADITPF